MTSWNNRAPRHEIISPDGIPVLVRPANDSEESTTFPARLKQISGGGARLITQRPLRFNESFRICISFAHCAFESIIDAQVAWARPLQADYWLMGCSFTPELPTQLLDSLSEIGLIDRRGSGRVLSRIPVELRTELSTDGTAASIVDFSQGGLCVESESEADLDQKVGIVLENNGATLRAALRVRWKTERTGKPSLFGCEFLSRGQGTEFRQALEDARFAEMNNA